VRQLVSEQSSTRRLVWRVLAFTEDDVRPERECASAYGTRRRRRRTTGVNPNA
jgi:hypothetical protein